MTSEILQAVEYGREIEREILSDADIPLSKKLVYFVLGITTGILMMVILL